MTNLVTPLSVTNWAKGRLEVAQKLFISNPSALNWNLCTQAMNTYQYVHWLFERGGIADGYQLIDTLTDTAQDNWEMLILELAETV